jgi:hypothetical protein
MIECPHCYTRVLPRLDGSCPSCLKNTQDAPQNRRARIALSKDAGIPDLCCCCGEYSVRRVNVELPTPESDNDAAPPGCSLGIVGIAFFALQAVAHLMVSLLQKAAANSDSSFVHICESCAATADVTVIREWPDRGELDLEVHPHFAAEFSQLNPNFNPSSGRWD